MILGIYPKGFVLGNSDLGLPWCTAPRILRGLGPPIPLKG